MFFSFFRPKPTFEQGEFVRLSDPTSQSRFRYMLIGRRRWIKPNGEVKKCWVYDGQILKVENGEMVRATSGSCYRERSLAPIPRLEYKNLTYVCA